jgi:hypothetical protein
MELEPKKGIAVLAAAAMLPLTTCSSVWQATVRVPLDWRKLPNGQAKSGQATVPAR